MSIRRILTAILKVAASFVLTVIVAAGAYFGYASWRLKTGEFTVSGKDVVAHWKMYCSSSGAPAALTILQGTEWKDGNLVVRVKDNDSCGGTKVDAPHFKVINSQLQLNWRWKANLADGVTACACDHEVRFELSNLPQRDYQVVLNRER